MQETEGEGLNEVDIDALYAELKGLLLGKPDLAEQRRILQILEGPLGPDLVKKDRRNGIMAVALTSDLADICKPLALTHTDILVHLSVFRPSKD